MSAARIHDGSTLADLAAAFRVPVRDAATALGLSWFDSDPEGVAAESLQGLGWTADEAAAVMPNPAPVRIQRIDDGRIIHDGVEFPTLGHCMAEQFGGTPEDYGYES